MPIGKVEYIVYFVHFFGKNISRLSKKFWEYFNLIVNSFVLHIIVQRVHVKEFLATKFHVEQYEKTLSKST